MASETVYDLGDEGLSDGELIDPYLESYWESNNEVHIPAGTYRWDGGHLGGTVNDGALIGQGDGVTFDISPHGELHNSIYVENGRSRVANITIRGRARSGKNRIRIEAGAPDATLTVDNVNLPDGGNGFGEHPSPIGFFVPSDNLGRVEIKNCEIRGFPNNGIYSSNGSGKTYIECCHIANNDVDNIRLGPNDEIHDCLVEMTDLDRHGTGRGVRVRYDGTQVVNGLHIINDEGPQPFISNRNEDAKCSLENVYIENNTSADAIRAETGTLEINGDVHVSGDGSLATRGNIRGSDRIRKGPDAEPPLDSRTAICGDE